LLCRPRHRQKNAKKAFANDRICCFSTTHPSRWQPHLLNESSKTHESTNRPGDKVILCMFWRFMKPSWGKCWFMKFSMYEFSNSIKCEISKYA
jgi:hypothetical protein